MTSPTMLEMEEEGLLGNSPAPHKRLQNLYHSRRFNLKAFIPRSRASVLYTISASFAGLFLYFIFFSSTGFGLLHTADAGEWAIFDNKSHPISDLPLLASEGLLELSIDELRERVSKTNGYFARDWSLSLGWNNMRYIIEGGLSQARLLNRTLVLPSFVYARACEFSNDVCAKHAKMVNRGDAVGSDEWRSLPLEKQMAWVIPLELMIDIPHLRAKHQFVTVSEYFRLQNITDLTKEKTNGHWDREFYHTGINDIPFRGHRSHVGVHPSLYKIKNGDYDPKTITLLDTLDVDSYRALSNTLTETGTQYDSMLLEKMKENRNRVALDWNTARDVIKDIANIKTDEDFEHALRLAGWLTTYTWQGAIGMEMTKTVVEPIRQVAPRSMLRGWVDQFYDKTEDVLLLEGEVHLERKPGFMRFTTTEARDQMGRIVLYDLRPPANVRDLAALVISRMDRVNHGRAWMAAHMRRGDFDRLGWAMEKTLQDHFNRLKRKLATARELLERLPTSDPHPYKIPDAHLNVELTMREPPKPSDSMYLATDEREEENLEWLRKNGATLFSDLIAPVDREQFGWPLLFTDIVALVEQQVIGYGSSYFYAHAMSSFAGGVINFRAANGCDERTGLVD